MPADPRRIKELFVAALELSDPQERQAFLEREGAGDPELRQRLELLLHAHDQPHPAVEQPLAPAATQAYESPEAEAPGTIIAGKYKLLQRIGEGGMGSVWMADQTEPVKRRVAVKLIRAEREGSRTILSRFEAERQAIALMDHPHIAKLLDAGTTGEPKRDPGEPSRVSDRVAPEEPRPLTRLGSPYFVMELVKGIPLNECCDAHKLRIGERLNLFMQICSAVQHAHQKGIIHRDLKPTNILVESHDGKPVPKVIDFGLAKALSGQPLTEHTLFTALGTIAGTPLYMAPEQAAFNAIDVDTRADIYALGVILYELLTGSTPIERESLRKAAFDEILRVIRESEPPTPSKRLSSTESKPSVAANRQMEPLKLGRFLKGELDWIVMKALAKERDRRYETANGFAKDIERFLNHEPVLAGPPTAAYRLRKFARKNRAALTTTAVIAFLLIAGVAVSTWQAVRATQAHRVALAAEQAAEQKRQEAEAAREAEAKQKTLAQAKEAEANAVSKFFEDKVFAAARPKGQDGGLGKDVALREAILASLPDLATGFADQPLVEARLRSVLGATLIYLGDYPTALPQFERARGLLSPRLGTDHADTLRAMTGVANVLEAQNTLADALALREEIAAAGQRAFPPDHRPSLRAGTIWPSATPSTAGSTTPCGSARRCSPPASECCRRATRTPFGAWSA